MIKTIARLACCGIAMLAIAGQNANADITWDFLTSDGGFVATSDGVANDWLYAGGSGWSVDGVEGTATNPSNNAYLTSPTFFVQSTGSVSLSFDHSFSFETDWDGGGIFFSVNGGLFDNYLEMPDYNNSVPLQGAHNLLNRNGYTGALAGYPALSASAVGDLGIFNAGDTLAFQFVGGWDQFALGNGTDEWILGSATVTNATAIPEPGTGLVLIFSGAMAFVGRRKR